MNKKCQMTTGESFRPSSIVFCFQVVAGLLAHTAPMVESGNADTGFTFPGRGNNPFLNYTGKCQFRVWLFLVSPKFN